MCVASMCVASCHVCTCFASACMCITVWQVVLCVCVLQVVMCSLDEQNSLFCDESEMCNWVCACMCEQEKEMCM
jgi:hypothetical protein